MQIIPTLVALLCSPLTWFMLVLGAIIGSFLNVCILRIPAHTFFKFARSVCDHCEKPVAFWWNIPVLSYFMLRGRTACCHQKLSIQYPLVEGFCAVLFVFLYYQSPFVVSFGGSFALDPANFIRFMHITIFCCVMLVCAVIDLHHQIIPDVLSIPMIILAPLAALAHPELTLRSCCIGIVAGGGSLYLLAWLYWLIRREYGLGMGDVKLLAAIGGWLGWQALLPTLSIGSILGAMAGGVMILFSRRMTLRTAIPFGPFLVLGACIHYFFGSAISRLLLTGG